ncbi:MAG: prolyl aminopeptidase [Rhodospirillaceae bacterium]|nr:prolyl aminopeptidase [Rhodospirillaceae bacterium]
MPRDTIFPPIEPYLTGYLPVDQPHRLYWEQSGNPNGAPAVFLHGGPGAGASPIHRRLFDPTHYRIVVFDQRGAGRSRPLGEIAENTTDHLVADVEALREHLGIERWHVFGGSWGSTLALAYAEAHPDRCASIILRGIFLMRRREIDWFLYGMGTIFPEAWRQFAHHIPPEERHDLLEAYYRRLIDRDPRVHMPAARAWSLYEGACSTLLPNPDNLAAASEDTHAIGLARIEAHYFRNNVLTPETRLLDDIDKIRKIPGVIVQGRYDVVCPIVTADSLHRAWPEARYVIVPDAGHSAMEPGIRTALIEASQRFRAIPTI